MATTSPSQGHAIVDAAVDINGGGTITGTGAVVTVVGTTGNPPVPNITGEGYLTIMNGASTVYLGQSGILTPTASVGIPLAPGQIRIARYKRVEQIVMYIPNAALVGWAVES